MDVDRGPGEAEYVPDERLRVAVVLLAAGSGSRLGSDLNKVFAPIAGRPMLSWSLEQAVQVATVSRIVVAVAERDRELTKRLLAGERLRLDARIVVGGRTRHDSEWHALQDLAPDITAGRLDVVVIHDGARPLAETGLFEQVINCAHRHGGAVPARPTMALIGLEHSPGDVVAVQTPQAFRAAALLEAYELGDQAGFTGTDTASCMESFSEIEICCVPGSATNIKITYPDDLRLAERLLARSGPSRRA